MICYLGHEIVKVFGKQVVKLGHNFGSELGA